MTNEEREETIRILQWLHDNAFLLRAMEEDVKYATKLAIQTLEQEPCEDAISRQAVHEAITRWAGSMSVLIALPTREVRPLLESIHKLPSAKPQENTGHWIGIDEEPHEVWECDHCGFVIDGSGCIDPYDYRDTYKYCPYCGARMVEEQESEVQDADSN